MKILIVGDPHIRTEYLNVCESFCSQIKRLVKKGNYDFVVVLGDVLHNHEKVNTVALNTAVNLFEYISKKTELFVLVGNHDYINNSQFLTSNHWLNCLKTCDRITVVDELTHFSLNSKNFVLCPYVPNGRLLDALNSNEEIDWKNADIIFAHQEIRSAKINSNGRLSTTGDVWYSNYPLLISGHIHHKQKIENVIYPGSSLPTSFSDSEQKYVLEYFINESSKNESSDESEVIGEENYIPLDIPIKITTHISINEMNEIDEKNVDENNRLIIEGSNLDFEKLETKNKLKKLEKNGITVVKRVKEMSKEFDKSEIDNNFYNQLKNLISKESDSENLLALFTKLI